MQDAQLAAACCHFGSIKFHIMLHLALALAPDVKQQSKPWVTPVVQPQCEDAAATDYRHMRWYRHLPRSRLAQTPSPPPAAHWHGGLGGWRGHSTAHRWPPAAPGVLQTTKQSTRHTCNLSWQPKAQSCSLSGTSGSCVGQPSALLPSTI